MPSGRDDILAFYDRLAEKDGVLFADVTRTFARALFRQREMPGCHVFTSHEVLCISRFPTHSERSDKPLLSITATSPNRLHFQLRIETPADDGVHRAITESANCPADRGFEEFDRLYAMFIAAHDARGARVTMA
jgi:hypothetical protein